MTDAEIKKALECCSKHRCFECPSCGESLCMKTLTKSALDLINRQQAEITSLVNSNVTMSTMYSYIKKEAEKARTKAIKEFAERLKEQAYRLPTSFFEIKAVNESWIDAILKEMVGESK